MTRFLLVLGLLSVTTVFAADTSLPYSYSRIVNKTPGIQTTPKSGVALMGGGTDVDAAFLWMCARAGNGDFLVIRATGTNAYNTYIKKLCPKLRSVATLIIPSEIAANHADVASYIGGAEAIFIAGGDQSNYINYWADTPVQNALNAHILKNAPIGGTSAGMMVLTQFLYPAFSATGVTSSQALADPYNAYMSLDRDFVDLPVLKGIFGDSHFVTRDRMGRDLAFMCRISKDYNLTNPPHVISVDEQTALLIDEYDDVSVEGSGKVYFIAPASAPDICQSQTPLTYDANVYRIAKSAGVFDLSTWTGQKGTGYSVSAKVGVLTSSQPGGSPY